MRSDNKLLSPVNIFLKRFFDLIFSMVLLILLLPFFVLAAVLIKLESRGPIFFVQERFGKNRKLFNLLKFRTMHTDLDFVIILKTFGVVFRGRGAY